MKRTPTYKPKYNLCGVIGFTMSRFDGYPNGTKFKLYERDGLFTATAQGRSRVENNRWIDSAFKKRRITRVSIRAAT